MIRKISYAVIALVVFVIATHSPEAFAPSLEDARAFYRAGQLEQAIDAFRAVADATENSDPVTAGICRNNACVLLTDRGELGPALKQCVLALELRRNFDDPWRVARTLNNLGRVQERLGNFDEAKRSFLEALALNRAGDDAAGASINLSNLGGLAIQAGWYSQAIDYQRRAYETAQQHQGEPWADEQMRFARVNQAVVLERFGAFREALRLYDAVIDEGHEMSATYRAGILVNRGVALRNLGDPLRALEAFNDASEIYITDKDHAALSNARLNQGLVQQLNLRDPVAAESSYRKALALAEASGERAGQIDSFCRLGGLLLDLGRADEALPLFERSLEISESSGSSEGRWASLNGLGHSALARDDSPAALSHFLAAINAIELVRDSLTTSTDRVGYFTDKRSVYESAIEVLAGIADKDTGGEHAQLAFRLAQQAKSRALLDVLGPGALVAIPLDAQAVIDALGDDVLLEYFIGSSAAFAWIVSASGIEMRSLGASEVILKDVEQIYDALSRGRRASSEAIERLSQTLLHDINLPAGPNGQLRVSPDNTLRKLPFELLELPAESGIPLIETVTISYLPSGSALPWLRRARESPSWMSIGFGNPQLPTHAHENLSLSSVLLAAFELEPLPAAADDVRAIERYLPGRHATRIGTAASETAFFELVGSGAKVVHIGAHTLVDERRGATILLTRDAEQDGLLQPHEIATLDISVELTVLAACRTASGPVAGGGALSTLTGSFLAAGSSGVLATLWDVGDQDAAVFMEQFYSQLGRGQTPAAALRAAKMRLRSEPDWNDPAVWSAYVLVGDAAPLVSRRITNGRLTTIVLASVALLLAIFLTYGIIRKRTVSD
ncbi:MAG: CHAT domain-containing protein [Acidobacteriota bacterium]|nr:CHAT domain-containing protein [Acidobacteriota bacterium]